MRHKTPKKRPCSCLGAGEENRAHRWRRCLRFRLVGRTVWLVGATNTKPSRDACNTKLSRNDRTHACARARKTSINPRVVSVFLFGCLYHGVCRCVSHKALTKPVQHKLSRDDNACAGVRGTKIALPRRVVFAFSFGWSYRVFGYCVQHKAFKERLQYKTLKKRSCPSLSAGDKNRSPASRRFCVFVWVVPRLWLLRATQSLKKRLQHKALKKQSCSSLGAGNENRAPSRRVWVCLWVFVWLLVPCNWLSRGTQSFQ